MLTPETELMTPSLKVPPSLKPTAQSLNAVPSDAPSLDPLVTVNEVDVTNVMIEYSSSAAACPRNRILTGAYEVGSLPAAVLTANVSSLLATEITRCPPTMDCPIPLAV